MITQNKRNAIRQRIHARIRQKLSGTTERPRLNVYRSLNHLYAQVIDDQKGETLVSASTLSLKLKTGGNVAAAKEIGKAIAEKGDRKGHQESGLRSRRLFVSRPHQGIGRCSARSRPGVLTAAISRQLSALSAEALINRAAERQAES